MTRPEGKYAWTVTVGEKGQIVIPKKARELFDIKPGDTLMVLADVEKASQSRQSRSSTHDDHAQNRGLEKRRRMNR